MDSQLKTTSLEIPFDRVSLLNKNLEHRHQQNVALMRLGVHLKKIHPYKMLIKRGEVFSHTFPFAVKSLWTHGHQFPVNYIQLLRGPEFRNISKTSGFFGGDFYPTIFFRKSIIWKAHKGDVFLSKIPQVGRSYNPRLEPTFDVLSARRKSGSYIHENFQHLESSDLTK